MREKRTVVMNDGREYRLITDFREDKKWRDSFNQLTQLVYGFDFENWYQNGYWKDNYCPCALAYQDRIIANVSVNPITFCVDGVNKQLVQIGTVMTHPEYREKGLSRFLMEYVLDRWEGKCDMIYLFANDSVLEFYPKFGFSKWEECQTIKEFGEDSKDAKESMEEKQGTVIKLDMEDCHQRKQFTEAVKRSAIQSEFWMEGNEDLIMFYCTMWMKDQVFYLPGLQTFAVVEYDGTDMNLFQVFAEKKADLEKVIKVLKKKDTRRVYFGFTPLEGMLDLAGLKKEGTQEEDTALFVYLPAKTKKADVEWLCKKKFMFPVLSHA